MHTTIVSLKNGEILYGPMGTFRPCFNWFTLLGDGRRICFDDCESVITPNERVSINSPIEGETQDEMKRAKQDLDWGRARGWTEEGKPYPKEKWDWEKRYEH